MIPEIHLLEPYALALGLPMLLAWWRWGSAHHGRWLRLAILLLLVLAAARPELAWHHGGSDVVLVLDRSASLGPARARHDELVRLVGEQRRTGDRLGVVLLGDGAVIAQGPQHQGTPVLGAHPLRDGASDLAGALDQAASLIPPGRSGRVIVHSDGEATGLDPRSAATRLGLAGVPVDVLPEARPALPDAAVLDIELPGDLRLGESFIGAARLISDADEVRSWRVLRDGKAIASGNLHLLPFQPATVTFPDRPVRAGLADYVVELDEDPVALLGARIGELGRRTAALLPSGVDAGSLQTVLDGFTRSEQGRALLAPLARPGPAREATLAAVHQAIESDLDPVSATLARGVLQQLLEEPQAERDRQPLNNTAHAALRIAGGERVLVMSGDGAEGNIAQALRSAGMAVELRGEGPLTLGDLVGCRTLVLDQVPADRLGLTGMEAVARWVEHLGGGLVLTGGRRSFGSGGYHRSPVERVLPVTMELRDEHRKLAVAIAITLDRSGSMMAPVAGGRVKMDLANEGAAAVIELLGPLDQVAVHAVDTAPHVIVPLTRVENPQAIAARVLGISSTGGGIYVYQALLAAGQELLDAKAGTRHLVLFADAADAEEPGDYQALLERYVKAGITVSVMALGSAKDSDAQFLEDVARRGNGRIAFAEAPEDLPRLFAQETMLVARSSWISERVVLQPRARLAIDLGNDAQLSGTWPPVPGYNLTYARDRAQVWAMAPGDPAAPAVAAWRIGGGRSVAICLDLDDPESPELLAWNGYAPLVAGVVRWAAGGEAGPGQLSVEHAGRSVTLRLELDPLQRQRWPLTPPMAVLTRENELGDAMQVPLEAVDVGRYEAVVALDDERTLVPSAIVDQQAIVGPAVRLPYSPEAEPRYGRRPGHEVLAAVARDSGGRVRSDLLDAFRNPPSPGTLIDLSVLLLITALVLAVGEILVRRLRLGSRPMPGLVPAPPASAPALARPPDAVVVPEPAAAPTADEGLHEALRQLRKRR
jgi:uncharacterized membrane protein